MDLDGLGKADLVVDTDDHRLVIENKFYAAFSGDDQMVRYSRYLQRSSNGQTPVLVLLTIRDRLSFYLAKLWATLSPGTSVPASTEIESEIAKKFSKNGGVLFRTVTWEDLLADFSSGSEIVDALRVYVENKYVRVSSLSAEEIMLANSSAVPILMQKIWATIDKSKDALSSSGYDVKRSSQSRSFYGYGIGTVWGTPWIISQMSAWEAYKTPFIIQVRLEWLSETIERVGADAAMAKCGFIQTEDLGYVYPIVISEEDGNDSVNELVSEFQRKEVEISKILTKESV